MHHLDFALLREAQQTRAALHNAARPQDATRRAQITADWVRTLGDSADNVRPLTIRSSGEDKNISQEQKRLALAEDLSAVVVAADVIAAEFGIDLGAFVAERFNSNNTVSTNGRPNTIGIRLPEVDEDDLSPIIPMVQMSGGSAGR